MIPKSQVRRAMVSVVAGLCAAGCFAEPAVSVSTSDTGVFYSTLSPYGEWVQVVGYGRVWRPNAAIVGADFLPYSSGGYWVDTEVGWSFESQWDWGWAPFHYGRWFQAPSIGWVWTPDTVWGASWCEWRSGGGYIGWRPLPPAGMTVQPAFVFVDTPHFVAPNVGQYIVAAGAAPPLLEATRPISTQTVNGPAHWFVGPPPLEISRATGHEIRPVALTKKPPAPGVVSRGPLVQARPHATAAQPVTPPVPAEPRAPGPSLAKPPPAYGGSPRPEPTALPRSVNPVPATRPVPPPAMRSSPFHAPSQPEQPPSNAKPVEERSLNE